jgi:hypothetical protein
MTPSPSLDFLSEKLLQTTDKNNVKPIKPLKNIGKKSMQSR